MKRGVKGTRFKQGNNPTTPAINFCQPLQPVPHLLFLPSCCSFTPKKSFLAWFWDFQALSGGASNPRSAGTAAAAPLPPLPEASMRSARCWAAERRWGQEVEPRSSMICSTCSEFAEMKDETEALWYLKRI